MATAASNMQQPNKDNQRPATSITRILKRADGVQKSGACTSCGDTGVCMFCDGKGVATFEEGNNMIFDESEGIWVADPNSIDPRTQFKTITKACHMCRSGICHYCEHRCNGDDNYDDDERDNTTPER